MLQPCFPKMIMNIQVTERVKRAQLLVIYWAVTVDYSY